MTPTYEQLAEAILSLLRIIQPHRPEVSDQHKAISYEAHALALQAQISSIQAPKTGRHFRVKFGDVTFAIFSDGPADGMVCTHVIQDGRTRELGPKLPPDVAAELGRAYAACAESPGMRAAA